MAVAAGCSNLSPEEWEECSDDEKEKLRATVCSVFSPHSSSTPGSRQPPTVVLYIGGRRSETPASDSFKLLSTCNEEYDNVHPDWISEDIKTTADLPCDWGWTLRSSKAYQGASFIFISGFYGIFSGKPITDYRKFAKEQQMVDVHMKVTLFHELIHVIRSVLYGTEHVTPPKSIDGICPLKKGREGEAGWLGERLAFGGVVNLNLQDGNINMYICTNDESKSPYRITENGWNSLFSETRSTPLSFEDVADLGPILSFIPATEHCKACLTESPELPTANITCLPGPASVYTYPADVGRCLVPVTGEFAEVLIKESELYDRGVIHDPIFKF